MRYHRKLMELQEYYTKGKAILITPLCFFHFPAWHMSGKVLCPSNLACGCKLVNDVMKHKMHNSRTYQLLAKGYLLYLIIKLKKLSFIQSIYLVISFHLFHFNFSLIFIQFTCFWGNAFNIATMFNLKEKLPLNFPNYFLLSVVGKATNILH